MSPFHLIEFILFSTVIQLFTMVIYIIFYSDFMWSAIFSDHKVEYDYIIVGAGTAGSLIAHRIAQETGHSFIVLEAGGRSNPILEIPVLGPLLHGSMYDWKFETTPQDHACLAMKDYKCRLPQGKIVGGSSKINNMVHVRGNISHYVDWFHEKHSYKYIEQTFDLIENKFISLEDVHYESELANAVLEASKELGYENLYSDSIKEFTKSKVSQSNGKRWTTSDNLDINKHVLSNVFVENVLLDGNTAYGVNFYHFGRRKQMFAKKGVILSAGTYNTPKILQLSGIGPKKVLKPLKIPIVRELPVGLNLQDHVATGLDLVLFNKRLSVNALNVMNPFNLFHYYISGKGPFTSPGCEAIGFISTKNESAPDIQFMVLPVGVSSDRGAHLRKSLAITNTVWYNYFLESFYKHTASILPILLHPKSKGEVYITSKDPKMPPLIDPKYLSNDEDVEVLVRGLNFVTAFLETKSMKSIGAYINSIPFPACVNFIMFSDSYWECYIRQLTLTSYHPVGTCSMGLPYSKYSVVDTNFKVIGVNNLFIADASVLPTLPSGNINAAVAMMASVFFDTNIADLVKANASQCCHRHELIVDYFYQMCTKYNCECVVE